MAYRVGTIRGKLRALVAILASVTLTLGLVPAAAFGVQGEEVEPLQLEAGTYVEHEAIAYVMDSVADPWRWPWEADVLDGADDLMDVTAKVAE